MRVIHYIPSIDKSSGGTAFYFQELSKSLGKYADLHILTAYTNNPVQIENTTIHWIDLSIKQIYRLKNEAKKLFNFVNPNLLHANTIWMPQNHFIQEAAHELGIPVVLTPHGMLEPWIINRNPWKKKLAMFLYQSKDIRKANLLHATCEQEKKHIQELGFLNEITVIPNGLDLSQIPSPKEEYGTKKVVFLSRIHPKKGIELLLQAWKQLEIKGWALEIAGNGEPTYITQLQKQVDKDHIQSVSIIGPKYGDDKWNFLKSADLFILPTYSENFGIVVAEALAVGVPVITTSGTPWEELKTYQCGWWIDLTIENLKNCLTQAISTKNEQLKAMGVRGIELIQQRYNIKTVANNINNCYKQIY